MEIVDRVKSSFLSLARGAHPRIDYKTLYRAKVVMQSGDLARVDLQPDDKDLVPGLTQIPLRHGLPGVQLRVPLGSYVLVGWADGDPQKPFAALWDDGEKSGGGRAPVQIVLNAADLHLGGVATQAAVYGDALKALLENLCDAIAGHTHPETSTTTGPPLTAASFASIKSTLGGTLSPTVKVK